MLAPYGYDREPLTPDWIDWNSPIEIDRDLAKELGVVAWWPGLPAGGNTLHDLSGNGYDLAVTGAPGWTFGPDLRGPAEVMSDSPAGAFLLNAAVLSSGPLSMAAWFNSTSIADNQTVMGVFDSASASKGFALVLNGALAGDPVALNCSDGVLVAVEASSTTGYAASAWGHACGVVASDTLRYAYRDGGNRGQNTSSRTVTDLNRFGLGVRNGSSLSAYMRGRLSDCILSRIAWSDDQVYFLYSRPFALAWQPSRVTMFHGSDFQYSPAPYVTAPAAVGGDSAYDSGNYRVHVFNTSGSLNITRGGKLDYLLVAGGGGGGNANDRTGGGGGGGGVLSGSAYFAPGDNAITIGSGGAGGDSPQSGSNSTAFGLTAIGGGRGGQSFNQSGASGGSGGGAYHAAASNGGAGTAGQGYAGGEGFDSGIATQGFGGGGGGGGGAVGNDATGTSGGHAGYGGDGFASSISGSATYYGGGGGGGCQYGTSWPDYGIGLGGLGGGGDGARGTSSVTDSAAVAGAANTGGGGGGGGGSATNDGAAGGSGVAIVRYPISGSELAALSYTRRKRISVDTSDLTEDLTNFPLLVKFIDDAEIGSGIDSNGYNIRFTTGDGQTPLAYDRRSFSLSGGKASGLFYVRVRTLYAGSPNDIYVYYKSADPVDGENKAEVWQDYNGVWALDESSGNAVDVSGRGNTLTDNGSVGTTAGQIGTARDFNGSTQYLSIDDASQNGLDVGASLTITCIVKLDATPNDNAAIVRKTAHSTSGPGYWLSCASGAPRMNVGDSFSNASATWGSALSTGVLYHIAGWRNGTSGVGLSVNGGTAVTGSTAGYGSMDNANPFEIGRNYYSAVAQYRYIDGAIDEVRVHPSVLSATRLKFEYQNAFESDNELYIHPEESSEYLSGYTKRKTITVDPANVDSDLTDFPLLVKITSDAQIGSDIDSNGYNIRFTTGGGQTVLDYDRRSFSVTNGRATGVFFVRVPKIYAGRPTELQCYYKAASPSDGEDKAGVWQNYEGVWPLDESSGNAIDVSGNYGNGTETGGTIGTAAGKITNARDFEAGDTEWFELPTTASFPSQLWTFSATVKPETADANYRPIIRAGNSPGAVALYHWNTNKFATFSQLSGSGSVSVSTTTPSTGTFYRVSGSYNGTTRRLYLNGVQEDSDTVSVSEITNDQSFRIGGDAFSQYYDGLIEDVRFINAELSADWQKFEYYNIFESDNELSWSAEQIADNAYLSGYTQRALIQVDHKYVDSTLTDFPLLVKIDSGSLLAAQLGQDIDDDGYNIRFTTISGIHEVPYERASVTVTAASTGDTGVVTPGWSENDMSSGTVIWQNSGVNTNLQDLGSWYLDAGVSGSPILITFAKLMKDGAVVGENKGSFAMPVSYDYVDFGADSSDLWGTTWKRDDFTDRFGLCVQATGTNTSYFLKIMRFSGLRDLIPENATITGIVPRLNCRQNGGWASIDYAEVTVYYSQPKRVSGVWWVKVSEIEKPDVTPLYVYFKSASPSDGNNPSAVWSDYAGVWHLTEASGDATDASGNGRTLTATGTVGTRAGKIQAARNVDGSLSNYLSIADEAVLSLSDSDPLEISVLGIFDVESGSNYLVSKQSGGITEWSLNYEGNNRRLTWAVGGSSAAYPEPSQYASTWYLIHAWLDPVNDVMGLRANAATTYTNSNSYSTDGAGSMTVGRYGIPYSGSFDGGLEELRIRRGALVGEDWRKFEYYNVFSTDYELIHSSAAEEYTTPSSLTRHWQQGEYTPEQAATGSYVDVTSITLTAANQKALTTYALIWSMEAQTGNTNSSIFGRLYNDTDAVVLAELSYEAKDNTGYEGMGGIAFFTTGEEPLADKTFSIEIKGTGDSRNARLVLLELDLTTDLVFEDLTTYSRTTTTLTTIASVGSYFATEPHFCLFSAEQTMSSVTSSNLSRLAINLDGTTTIQDISSHSIDVTDVRGWNGVATLNLSGPHTFNFQAAIGGTGTGTTSRIRLLVLPSSAFFGYQQQANRTATALSSSTPTTLVSATVSDSADYLVLTGGAQNMATNTVDAQWQVNDGTTTYINTNTEMQTTTYRCQFFATALNISASKTFYTQHSREASSTVTTAYSDIVILQLTASVSVTIIDPTLIAATTVAYSPTLSIDTPLAPGFISGGTAIYQPSVTVDVTLLPDLITATTSVPSVALDIEVPISPTFISAGSVVYSPRVVYYVRLTDLGLSGTPFGWWEITAKAPFDTGLTLLPALIAATSVAYSPTLNIEVPVSPNFISAGTANYQPTVTVDVPIAPSFVAATTSVYEPDVTVDTTVIPAFIASAASIYQPEVTVDVTVAPTFIASGNTVYQPAFTGDVTVTPLFIAAGTVTYSPTLAIEIPVAPAFITSTTTLFDPVFTGDVTLLPALLGATTVVYSTTLDIEVLIEPNFLPAGSSVYQPGFSATTNVSPLFISSGAIAYTPALDISVLVQPGFIAAATSLYEPSVSGDVTLLPVLISATTILYEPVFTALTAVQPTFIVAATSLYAPAVSGDVPLAPAFISSTANLYEPAVSGDVPLTPVFITATTSLYEPAFTALTTLLPVFIASGSSAHTPTLDIEVLLTPTFIAAASTVYQPGVSTTTTIVPAFLSAGTSVPNPLVTGGLVLEPAFIGAGTTIYQPGVTVDVTIVPGFIAAGSVVYQPGVSTTTTIVPAFISSGSTVYQPAVAVVLLLAPTFVAAGSTVYQPGISGDVTLLPGLISATTTVYQPNLSGQVTIAPAFISAGTNSYQPALSIEVPVTPAFISSGSVVYSPAAAVDVPLTPAFIVASSSVFQPGVSTTTTITPVFILAGSSVPQPAISTTTTITPPAIGTTTTVFATGSLSTTTTIYPALLGPLASTYSPVFTADVTITPAALTNLATVYEVVLGEYGEAGLFNESLFSQLMVSPFI